MLMSGLSVYVIMDLWVFELYMYTEYTELYNLNWYFLSHWIFVHRGFSLILVGPACRDLIFYFRVVVLGNWIVISFVLACNCTCVLKFYVVLATAGSKQLLQLVMWGVRTVGYSNGEVVDSELFPIPQEVVDVYRVNYLVYSNNKDQLHWRL